MKNIRQSILALTLMASLAGCASIGDGIINCEMSIRNKILAQKAWGHWSWCYGELEYPWHFAKGFKAGYQNILNGGNGCQPTLPPKCYWKPDFQTPEGHCMIHAWFDGFSHGALAAKQDGYGALGELPISPTARANIELNRMPREDTNFYNGAGMMPVMEGGILPPPTGDDQFVMPVPDSPTTNGMGGIEGPTGISPERPYEE